MKELNVATKRGTVLNGVLFDASRREERIFDSPARGFSHGEKLENPLGFQPKADTVVIAITGIHGNFHSNPFYWNFGDTLNAGGIDFVYAQTNDALGAIRTRNVVTGKEEIIGSWNERFAYTDEDIEAYLDWAEGAGYKHIILGGHSLGANKVIYYLSRHHDPRVERFMLLSPANLTHMMSGVTDRERDLIRRQVARGDGDKLLPFYFMGWVECVANTAYDWAFTDTLNNVHVEKDADFTQVSRITHTGALLIGTYDRFTYGDPAGFLKNINDHMPTAAQNKLIFIEKTGHTYQQKEQEVANRLLQLVKEWEAEPHVCGDGRTSTALTTVATAGR